MFTRQALYHLNHTSRPFCFGYFENRVSLLPQASLDCGTPSYFRLPTAVAGRTGMHHHIELFSVEMRSRKLFCWS
jgi:hypothetical protein